MIDNQLEKKTTSVKGNTVLQNAVFLSLDDYFKQMEDLEIKHLHDLFISEVEKSLFTYLYQKTQGNRSRMASILGINRATLRKKLEKYFANSISLDKDLLQKDELESIHE